MAWGSAFGRHDLHRLDEMQFLAIVNQQRPIAFGRREVAFHIETGKRRGQFPGIFGDLHRQAERNGEIIRRRHFDFGEIGIGQELGQLALQREVPLSRRRPAHRAAHTILRQAGPFHIEISFDSLVRLPARERPVFLDLRHVIALRGDGHEVRGIGSKDQRGPADVARRKRRKWRGRVGSVQP